MTTLTSISWPHNRLRVPGVIDPNMKKAIGGYGVAVLALSPVAYYRLEESSGTTAADTSGNGLDATISTNGVTLGVAGAPIGDPNTAFTFNSAQSGKANSAASSLLTLGLVDQSLALWLKFTGTGFQGVSSVRNATNIGLLISINRVTTVGRVATECWNWVNSKLEHSAIINDGNWHFVVSTFELSTMKLTLYVDNYSPVSAVQTGTPNTASNWAMYIGNNSNSQYFTGSIDEVAYFNRCLTAADVANLYSAAGY